MSGVGQYPRVDDMVKAFRVTGPQSIDRLEPLVPQVVPGAVSVCSRDGRSGELMQSTGAEKLDFVWETACEVAWRARHSEATVLNKLHNVVILEDKANLAFVQLRMNCPVLDTYIAGSAEVVCHWAKGKWSSSSSSSKKDENDWWVVKASAGNGGKDIWVMTCANYDEVISELPKGETFVIQRYVARPMLWKGKKFHFRCYSVIRADMTALLYQMAYILTAGFDYTKDDSVDTMDSRRLITNLSVNKAIEGHPGQVPCNVKTEYPQVFGRISVLWGEVAKACSSFMKHQTSANHFEFFGIDVIADEDGTCWLLEVNRLPGLEASSQNKQEEDVMYDEMMLSLLRIVLAPLRSEQGEGEGERENEGALWDKVHDGGEASESGTADNSEEKEEVTFSTKAPCWKNTFGWKAFTRKKHNRSLVVLGQQPGSTEGAGSSSSSGGGGGGKTNDKEKEGTSPGAAGAEEDQPKCGVLGCSVAAKLRCSRCKNQHYCSPEHQKSDWSAHKRLCKSQKEKDKEKEKEKVRPPKVPENGGDAGARQSRCFFCGENIVMKDEYDAQLHMQECPALQEQLNSSDQFTIPKALRDKGVTLHDVEQKHEQEQQMAEAEAAFEAEARR